jgi:hypothetical protein
MPQGWQQAGWAAAEPPSMLNTSPNVQVAPERRSTRLRWVIALVGAILIVATGVGVTVFAVGSQSNASIGPTFLPATTPLYAEARLDLPGTERDNVIKFIAHFPGFADQSSFDTKVDEALDKWVGDATGHQLLYTRDLKPWFSGQVAVGLLELPAMSTPNAGAGGPAASAQPVPTMPTSMPGMAALRDLHFVVGIGVKDRARLDTLVATARSMASNLTFTEQPNGDRTIVSVSDSSDGTAQFSYVVTDKLLLLAPSADDLATALGVLDGTTPSLANDPGYTAATANLPADRLGEMYAGPAYYQQLDSLMTNLYTMPMGNAMGNSAQTAGIMKCLQVHLIDPASASSAAALVVGPDNVSLQGSITNAFSLPVGTSTDLATHVPESSLAYLQVPNVGPAVHDLVSCLRTNLPDAFSDKSIQQIEQALGNPLEDELTFVGDVGVSVGVEAGQPQVGLVASVSDQPTALSRITTLLSLIRAAAATGNGNVAVKQETVGSTQVTTITWPTDAMRQVPFNSISVALTDDGHLYIGSGDYAKEALNIGKSNSLASDDRYSSAMKAVGDPTGVQLYVDVTGVRQLIEGMSPANPDYTTNIQPYLVPFDRFAMGTSQNGTTASSQMVLFVK